MSLVGKINIAVTSCLAVLLLLGDGGGVADLDAEGSLDLLLGGLLSSSLR